MPKSKTTVNLPWSPEEFRNRLGGTHITQWDEWYRRLPDDLKHKLSIYDFKRLGDLFKEVFKIPES